MKVFKKLKDSYNKSYIIPMLTMISLWIFLALLYIMKRPDMLLNPQPWAEDGSVFIKTALSTGMKSILTPYAGYLHLVPRLVTSLSIFLSEFFQQGIMLVPTFMNCFAIIIGVSCVFNLLRQKFDWLAPLQIRLVISIFIIINPYYTEIYGNITNIQWWMGYFLFLEAVDIFVNDRPPSKLETIMIAIASVTGIFSFIIVITLIMVFIKKCIKKDFYALKKFLPIIFLSVSGVLIQFILSLSRARVGFMNGRTIVDFFPRYFFTTYFVKYFISFYSLFQYTTMENIIFISVIIAVAMFYVAKNIRIGYMSLLIVFLLALLNIIGERVLLDESYLVAINTFNGGRYNFIPYAILTTILFSSVYIVLINKERLKFVVGTFLILMTIVSSLYDIPREDFNYNFVDYHWKEMSKQYEGGGEDILEVSINPTGWYLELPYNKN